jgi:hypothetical protein
VAYGKASRLEDAPVCVERGGGDGPGDLCVCCAARPERSSRLLVQSVAGLRLSFRLNLDEKLFKFFPLSRIDLPERVTDGFDL